MKQVIRIIGGQYRGKKLQFPDVDSLRPTPDRVRETLFNWLMHDIHDKRCLDAFAGSGALGFEALSRGASEVTLVEQSAKAYQYLVRHQKELASPKLTVLKSDTLRYLQSCNKTFDIIFLDPPFKGNFLPKCIELIEQKNLLSTKGLLYIEAPEETELDPSRWVKLKVKKSGQVTYGLYRRY